MKQFQCKDGHSTLEKFRKLCTYADELGLEIEFYANTAFIHDVDMPERRFRIEDIENGNCTEFPPSTEFKLTFNKD